MRPIQILATMAAAAVLAGPGTTQAQESPVTTAAGQSKPVKTGYIDANGVKYYYEVHGQGEPLLLLHGGLGSIDMFGPALPVLAKNRQVIAVDLHGSGRTTLGDREISLIDMGDDMAVILRQLGYSQVDALGYSMGAGVAFRLAVQHPATVRRLALVSARFRAGWLPSGDAAAAGAGVGCNGGHDEGHADVPVVPGGGAAPAGLPQIARSHGGAHGWMRENMSQNRLAILPDLTHYDIFMSPALPATVLPFLNGLQRGSRNSPIR